MKQPGAFSGALAALAGLALAASACGGAQLKSLDLPPPLELGALGPGDVFELYIVGEEKLPTTFTVAPDGTADLPYVKRVQAVGLAPQELADVVRERLVAGSIRVDPTVSVRVREYNSKRIDVLGEVQKPGSIPLEPGMTLLRAISVSGGFNAMANKGRVTIRRRVKGGTRAATVSVEDIIGNRIPDPMLQAGDSVNVEQRFL